jgi:hypothetical protein
MLDIRDSATYIPSFTPGVIVGLVLDGLAGLASTLAAVVILVLIFVRLQSAAFWFLLTLITAAYPPGQGRMGAFGCFGGVFRPRSVVLRLQLTNH